MGKMFHERKENRKLVLLAILLVLFKKGFGHLSGLFEVMVEYEDELVESS